MSYQVLTEIAASISELKANPMKVVASGEACLCRFKHKSTGVLLRAYSSLWSNNGAD